MSVTLLDELFQKPYMYLIFNFVSAAAVSGSCGRLNKTRSTLLFSIVGFGCIYVVQVYVVCFSVECFVAKEVARKVEK